MKHGEGVVGPEHVAGTDKLPTAFKRYSRGASRNWSEFQQNALSTGAPSNPSDTAPESVLPLLWVVSDFGRLLGLKMDHEYSCLHVEAL